MFHRDDLHSTMPTTERIPAVLMEPFLGKGHVLFTDNFYTSPSLAEFLLQNNTHLCGTVKHNRKFYAHQLVPLILEKGQAAFFKTDVPKMLACKYRAIQNKANKQPKVVFMLSTAHPAEMNATRKSDREGNAVHKPTMIRAYAYGWSGPCWSAITHHPSFTKIM